MTDTTHRPDNKAPAEGGWNDQHRIDDAIADGSDEVEHGSFTQGLADLLAPLGGGDNTPDPGPGGPSPYPDPDPGREPGRDLPEPPEIPDGRDLPNEVPPSIDPPVTPPGSPYMESERSNRSGGDLMDDDPPDSLPGTRSIPL